MIKLSNTKLLTHTFFVVILTVSLTPTFARDAKTPQKNQNVTGAQQQMTDFSLAGYGEKGAKAWDLAGQSADIFDNVVKLNNITGNMYGKNEDIKLTANKGDFDKTDGKVHLEKNVVVTTSKGTKLTTNSLDWDRKNEKVSTVDPVNISRDNMVTTAMGAIGEPSLNKVTLGKDVQVDIHPKPGEEPMKGVKNKITITCDGPLEIDYQKNVATFKNNVKVDTEDKQIYSDTMEVYFLTSKKEEPVTAQGQGALPLSGTSIDKIVSRGNVKIVSGENVSYSDEAVYSAADKRIVLNGRPRLIISTTEGFSASSGN